MAEKKLHVVVWDENPPHAPKELYPEGIRGAVAAGLKELDVDGEFEVEAVSLDDPDQGFAGDRLTKADVLLWWGHARHGEVKDELAEAVAHEVHTRGMGFISLHSGHYAKPFKKVLNCTGHLKGGWREADDSEVVHVCAPWHPIAEGVESFTLDDEEMYGAPFDVPAPHTLVFQSHFPKDGAVFPSGICWTVGEGIDLQFTSGNGNAQNQGEGIGRVFYFRPGHESYGTYFLDPIKRVIYNAVRWTGKITPFTK